MEIEQIKDKKTGKVMKTKDGVVLQEFKFEIKDTFIPIFNKPMEFETEGLNPQTNKVEKFKNYKLKCYVKHLGETVVKDNKASEEIFVTLTKGQYDSFMKKFVEDKAFEPNQHLWVAFGYISKLGKDCVGIGLKGSGKKAKTFDEFVEVEEN
jgi:hypothetical protein